MLNASSSCLDTLDWRALLRQLRTGQFAWTPCRSSSNIEQLVDELNLARDLWLPENAVATPDHPHEFEALDGRISRSHRLKTGLDGSLF